MGIRWHVEHMAWSLPCVKMIEQGVLHLDQNELVGKNERRKRKR